MAMTRCKANLHFYDADKQSSCPYCERLNVEQKPVVPVEAESSDAADICSDPTIVILDPERHRTQAELTSSLDRASAAQPTVLEPTPGEPVEEQYVETELFTVQSSSEPDQKTVMLCRDNAVSEPVAGWLVCVQGPGKGRDYRIKAGMNEIAREEDPEVDIVIRGDNSISRRYHAEIQYDPDENEFYLIKLKNEAVMLNDQKVKRPVQLSPYDIIQLGETRLVFVPLCSEKFKWKWES